MWIGGVVDSTDGASVASNMRRKRFDLFLQLVEDLPRPVRILDVGGRLNYWQIMGYTSPDDIHVTLVNLEDIAVEGYDNFEYRKGDARHMPEFADNEFEVVFSNSVIEHVGGLEDQRAMAQEIRRIGKRYYVQTPNYYFPMEPHFLVPFFQMMPLEVRARLHANFDLGWVPKTNDLDKAREDAAYIRLMKRHEVEELFPGASLFEEKFAGMTKSFVAYSCPHSLTI